MIDTVIFDLDGTILNTLDDLKAAVDHALAAEGFGPLAVEHVRRFVGNGIRKLTDRALLFSATRGARYDGDMPSELKDRADACYARCLEYYGAHSMDKTRLYDGVAELIARLKSNGIKTAVVTNKVDGAAQDLHAKLFPNVDFVVGVKTGISPKPSCDGVNAALAALGSKKENAIYVGDGETDIATAKNAGLSIVAVTWGFRDRAVLEELEPDRIIDKPSELLLCLGMSES